MADAKELEEPTDAAPPGLRDLQSSHLQILPHRERLEEDRGSAQSLNRALERKDERHMLPNLIAIDFYRTGDLFKVIETLNGVKIHFPP
jgi:hypothetical protein